MREELLAYALLMDVRIISHSEYTEYLDTQFIRAPDDDLLLELEWCFSDIQKAISIVREHYYDYSLDYATFGRFLFSKLQDIYFQNKMDIQTFAAKSYAVWSQLPNAINQTEPFWTLSYADDPLSWGDEKQTRELYEKAFRFYDKA